MHVGSENKVITDLRLAINAIDFSLLVGEFPVGFHRVTNETQLALIKVISVRLSSTLSLGSRQRCQTQTRRITHQHLRIYVVTVQAQLNTLRS